MGAIASQLSSLVGTAALVPWEQLSEPLQQTFTEALRPDCQPEAVVYPESQEALAEIVTWASRDQVRLLPIGNGSKLKWGGLADGIQVIVSTERLNRVLDHAVGDMTVTVEAGISFQTLQETLAQTNQFFSIDPAYPEVATLGGIVATADAGALRHRYGGIRDLLIGLSLVRSDGQVAKAGGRVVKNVAGYDLMKLMTGSYGSLGILSQLTLRLYPIPEASGTVILVGNAEAIAQLTQAILLSSLSPTAMEVLAASTVTALNLGQGMGLLVRFQSIAVSVEQQMVEVLDMAQQVGVTGDRLTDQPEADLWKQLRACWDQPAHSPAVTCKIGVRPSDGVTVLEKLSSLASLGLGTIHAGSGLGMVQAAEMTPATLQEIRQLCETHGGFLSVLEAPTSLKQQVDVWGMAPGSLPLMKGIKQRFDPRAILSAGRFVDGC
ncbi:MULTISPECIES: FAD-binding oxidoreductase [unclassified Leptolyngbya]|nr:FAD-binding oxidoreductase [Leptolyngbya sp. FACHB-8]MBD2158379.1 FAD-binding oxidoreductase [Leptolyngbya sp. FACHB-16]